MKLKQLLLGLVLVTLPVVVMAHGQDEWIVKIGVAHVAPDASSGPITSKADGSIVIPGSPVDVDSGTALGITIGRMLNENIGLELLAATPFAHDLEGDEALAGLGKIGEIEHLPPSLLVQYHFSPDAKVQPYVGAGANYTFFFNEESSSSLDAALGAPTDISLDDSFGLAAQAGVDVMMNNGWFFNAALWWLDIETTAEIQPAGAGALEVDVDVDPLVYMIGFGKTF